MAKPEWGKKRICPACALKYYDFNKSPITCPACKVEFDPDMYLKGRKGKTLSPKVDRESSEDISNIDDTEIETDGEVVSDDDPLLELNKEDKDTDNNEEIDIQGNIEFIQDDDLSEDDENSIEVVEDKEG